MNRLLRTTLSRWKAWNKRSVNRRIFAALLTVGSFAALGKVVSAAKDIVVAHDFGASDTLDAFLIAYMLPEFAFMVLAGALNAALIPTLIEVREHEGREAAQRLLWSVTAWSAIVLAAVSVGLALSASYVLPIVAHGFSTEKLTLTLSLFYFLIPVVVVEGVAILWAAVLNSGERFALAALTPLIIPSMTIISILVMRGSWGIYSLASGVVFGCVLEMALVGWGVSRQGFSLIPRWYGRWYRLNAATRQVVRQYVPLVAGQFLASGSLLVDQSIATTLGSGSVSALSYGNKIVAVLMGVGSIALGTAALPYFAKMVAAHDWSGVRNTLKTYGRLILLATIPLTLILVYLSEPLVRLLFQRGAFTAEDTILVSQVQIFYLLQIPIYMLAILVVRLISSLRANNLLMWGALGSFSLNLVLDYVFSLFWGVTGIALATTVVHTVTLCYLSYALIRLMRSRETRVPE